MPELIITRKEYDLRNGSNHEHIIFRAKHQHSKMIDRMLKLLVSNQTLEGGDKVVIIKTNHAKKVIRQEYCVCQVCRENPVMKGKLECKPCLDDRKERPIIVKQEFKTPHSRPWFAHHSPGDNKDRVDKPVEEIIDNWKAGMTPVMLSAEAMKAIPRLEHIALTSPKPSPNARYYK